MQQYVLKVCRGKGTIGGMIKIRVFITFKKNI